MATNNPIMSVLSPYVDQELNREQLIAKAVLEPKTAKMFNLQTGVKGPTTINLLSTEVTFGDGSTCGFSEAGSITISQRQIVPAVMKVNLEMCERNLLSTYAQYQVKIKAGLEEMPFEEYILSDIAANVKNKLEKFVWQGDSDETETQFDGLIKILTDDDSDAIIVEAGATESATVLGLYNALPNEAHADDTVIFAAPSKFRKWIQELVADNMFHHNPNDKDGEYTIPGTNVKVVAVPGLEGATGHEYVAGRMSNFFYGVDIEDAADTVKVVYDEVKETFLIKMLFNAGVQVAYPDQVAVLGTITPDPTNAPG